MEIIQVTKEGLNHLPHREVLYFGPKLACCSEKHTIHHKKYIFEQYFYEIKGNGHSIIKVFDQNGVEVFENLIIKITNLFSKGHLIYFSNKSNSKSTTFFEQSVHIETIPFGLVLDKLIFIADKKRLFKDRYRDYRLYKVIQEQYLYAYLTYLFFPVKAKEISADGLSSIYRNLKKMKSYYSRQLSDNLIRQDYFPTDTLEAKIFERFVNNQIEAIKKKPIVFD